MKRITLLAAAGVLLATPAAGAWAAFASTDDSPARHTLDLRVDDRGRHARHGEPEPGGDRRDGDRRDGDRRDDRGAHRQRGHARHGTDDGVRHHRHGGDDD
jgi:hypothetical protein